MHAAPLPLSMTWPQYLRRECSKGPWLVSLTRRQADILIILLINRRRFVRVDDLIEAVYPDPDREPDYATGLIRTQIFRMRCKLGHRAIKGARSFGYMTP